MAMGRQGYQDLLHTCRRGAQYALSLNGDMNLTDESNPLWAGVKVICLCTCRLDSWCMSRPSEHACLYTRSRTSHLPVNKHTGSTALAQPLLT